MKGPHYHAKDIAIIPIAGLCHSFLKGLWECWDGCFSFCLNCQYFISFFWLHILCHFPDHISSSRCLKFCLLVGHYYSDKMSQGSLVSKARLGE